MKPFLALLLIPACVPAASWKGLLKFTQATLVAGSAADAASSYGKLETNPALGRSQFGGRQLGIKLGISGVLVASEYLVTRKQPRAAKPFAVLNLAGAAVFGAAASHNSGVK